MLTLRPRLSIVHGNARDCEYGSMPLKGFCLADTNVQRLGRRRAQDVLYFLPEFHLPMLIEAVCAAFGSSRTQSLRGPALSDPVSV